MLRWLMSLSLAGLEQLGAILVRSRISTSASASFRRPASVSTSWT